MPRLLKYDYLVIGGPINGARLTWFGAKLQKNHSGYRAPTLAELHAWGWPLVIVWEGL